MQTFWSHHGPWANLPRVTSQVVHPLNPSLILGNCGLCSSRRKLWSWQRMVLSAYWTQIGVYSPPAQSAEAFWIIMFQSWAFSPQPSQLARWRVTQSFFVVASRYRKSRFWRHIMSSPLPILWKTDIFVSSVLKCKELKCAVTVKSEFVVWACLISLWMEGNFQCHKNIIHCSFPVVMCQQMHASSLKSCSCRKWVGFRGRAGGACSSSPDLSLQ